MACRDNYSKRKAGRGDGSCDVILHITEEFSSLPSPQLTSSRGSECSAEYERHKSPGDFKKESFKRSFKKKQHGSASSPDITDLTGDPEPTTSTSCPPTPTPQYHSLLPCTRAQKRSQGPSEGREGAKMKVSRFATLVNQASPQSDILCTNTDKFVLNTRRSLPNLIDGRRSRRREPRKGAAQSPQDTNTQCTLATMTSRTRNGLARAVAGDGWKKESCRGREAKRSGSSDSVAEVVVLDDDDEDVSLAVTGSEPGRQTAKEPHGQSPVRPHQTDVSLQEAPSAQESNSASPSGKNTSLSSIAVLFSGTNTPQAAPPPPRLTRPPPVWSDACLGVETSQLSSPTSPPRSAPASAKKPPASHDLVSYSIDSDSEDDEGASSLQQVAREADAKSMANNRCVSPLTSANGTLHNRPFTPRSTPNTYLPPRPGREVSVTDARLECATPSSVLNQSRGDENPCPSPSPPKSGVFVPRKRLSLRRGPRLSDVKPHDTDHQTVVPAHSHNPFRHNPVKKSPHFDKSGQADLTSLTDTPSANPVKKSPHFNKPVQADLASLTDTPSARPSSSETLIPSRSSPELVDLNVAPLIESETSDDDDDLPALATSVFGNSSQREWETRRSQRVSVGSASGRELTIHLRAGARHQLSSTSEDDCVIAEEKAPKVAEAGPTLGSGATATSKVYSLRDRGSHKPNFGFDPQADAQPLSRRPLSRGASTSKFYPPSAQVQSRGEMMVSLANKDNQLQPFTFKDLHIQGVRTQALRKPVRVLHKRKNLLVDYDSASTAELRVVTVQIGTLADLDVAHAELSGHGLSLKFSIADKTTSISVEFKDIEEWKMNFSSDPKLICFSLFMGQKIKNIIAAHCVNKDYYNGEKKYIFLRFKETPEPNTIVIIEELLDTFLAHPACGRKVTVDKQLSPEAAQQLLADTEPTQRVTVKNAPPRLLRAKIKASNEVEVVTTGDSKTPPPLRRSSRRAAAASSRQGWEEAEEVAISPRRTDLGPPDKKLLTYKPEGSKLNLVITVQDVFCLDKGEYLNDRIMDFYLMYLWYARVIEQTRLRFHIFSSFFHNRLINSSHDRHLDSLSTPEKMHSRVKSWTRHVDLFTKDFIVIPICDRAHWYVVIVCYPGTYDPSIAEPAGTASRRRPQSAKSGSKRKKFGKPRKVKAKSKTKTPVGAIKIDVSDHSQESSSEMESVCTEDPLGGGTAVSHNNGRAAINGSSDSEGGESESDEGIVEDRMEGEGDAEENGNIRMSTEPTLVDEDEDEMEVVWKEAAENSPVVAYCRDRSSIGAIPGALLESASLTGSLVTIQESPPDSNVTTFVEDSLQSEEANEQYLGVPPHTQSRGMCLSEDVDECLFGEITGVAVAEEKEAEEEEEEEEKVVQRSRIMVLDSLGVRRLAIVKKIRSYLTEEWKFRKTDCPSKEFTGMPVSYPNIPLQANSSDCGLFVLQYVESLLLRTNDDQPPPSKRSEWGESEIGTKRRSIEDLIVELSKQ